MKIKTHRSLFCTTALVTGLAATAGSLAYAQSSKDTKQAGSQPEMKLPPGWTAADMQACVAAGTPGKMHERLAERVGVWIGKTEMWMAPETDSMKSEATNTITALMDGRYFKSEVAGDMPGMGPFQGFGLTGYDNVSQKFVSTWVDNQGTGIMNGLGELSKDGKTMTWNFTYNCPITKKATVMRQIETYPNANKMTYEMFAIDPKSGKEYKAVRIEFTRKT